MQWQIIQPLLPPPSKRGAPQKIHRREILNGVLGVNRTGCQWRAMPNDLPNWHTRVRRLSGLDSAESGNAALADAQGISTIVDDEPRISIGDVSKKEGKKDQSILFPFTVTLLARLCRVREYKKATFDNSPLYRHQASRYAFRGLVIFNRIQMPFKTPRRLSTAFGQSEEGLSRCLGLDG